MALILWIGLFLGLVHAIEVVNTIDWLDWSQLSTFRSRPLAHSVYKQWRSLQLLEKIPYLVDSTFLVNAHREYAKLCIESHGDRESRNSTQLADEIRQLQERDCGDGLSEDIFQHEYKNLASPREITQYFASCDAVTGRAPNGFIDWTEFVMCRGLFDRYGKPFDVSEFDFLENILISDYREQLNDPRNPMVLDLIARGEEL